MRITRKALARHRSAETTILCDSLTDSRISHRLKDSDVTWLYGPLHVGTDWTDYRQPKKSPHKKTSMDNLPSLASSSSVTTPSAPTTKPILKRRSISQLLSLPASHYFDQDASEENDSEDEDPDGVLERPKLLHTKSDTHISWRSRPHRKDSPPRIIASEVGKSSNEDGSEPTTSTLTTTTLSAEESSRSSTDSSQSDDLLPKKKHISFNTFVEQCIAIEKPKPKRKSLVGARTSFFHEMAYDDGSVFVSHVSSQSYTNCSVPLPSHYTTFTTHRYDEDSEAGYEYESDEPSSFFLNDHDHDRDRNSSEDDEDEDDDDDDDDVLEMKTSRSRSSSMSSTRSHYTPFTQSDSRTNLPSSQAFGNNARPPIIRQSSIDRERVTIAPIAPTILKSTGVGNNLSNILEGDVTPVPKEVALVYVPPSNSIYSLPGTPNIGGDEEVYHHRESYFSIQNVNAQPSSSRHHSRSLSAGSSPAFAMPVQIVNHSTPSNINEGGLPRSRSKTILSSYFGQAHIVDSPQEVQTDAYDYFGGPDLGEDFGLRHNERERRTHLGRRRRNSTDDKDDEDEEHVKMVRYSQGGASSVSVGRSSGESRSKRDGWSGSISNASSESLNRRGLPSVVINEVAGAEEEREEDSGTPVDVDASSSGSVSTSIGSAIPIAIRPQARESPDVHMGSVGSGPMSMGSGPTNPSPLRQSALPAEQSYLTPPEPANVLISRGRSPQCVVPSHSGSTTTGSYSHSSDSRSESRGRSSTRTSSYSDPERSGSRGSRGTNSPMGSISPTGSSIGIGGGRGRERDSRVPVSVSVSNSGSRSSLRGRSGGGGGDEERGRDRSGRRLENSMSPPSAMGSPVRVPSDVVDSYQPYSPALLGASLERRPHSPSSSVLSGDSGTTSSSTVGPNTAHAPKSESGSSTASEGDSSARTSVRPRLAAVPSPIPEEEEGKSRMSTPVPSVAVSTSAPPRPQTPPPPKVVNSSSTAAQSQIKPVTPPSKITTSPSSFNSPSPNHHAHHAHHHTHSSSPSSSSAPSFHSPNHSVRLSKATVVQPVTSPSEATATTSPPLSPASIRSVERSRVASPEREGLLGRAADLASSARGFLGSIWNSSSSSNSNSLNG